MIMTALGMGGRDTSSPLSGLLAGDGKGDEDAGRARERQSRRLKGLGVFIVMKMINVRAGFNTRGRRKTPGI